MSDTIAVGIVGLGGLGNGHAENVRTLGHEVGAGADVQAEARERFASKFDVSTYESHGAMFEAEDLDAVMVTTPNAYHVDPTVDALNAGYSVLCEKPLADDLSNAERMVETARDAEGFLMTGFSLRFTPPVQLLKAYQSRGRFGETTHVQVNYVRRRSIPKPGSWFGTREIAGGGALIDIGVHAIDLALHCLDFPDVLEVCGQTRSQFGSRPNYVDTSNPDADWETYSESFDVDDSASGFVRCADGKTISFETAWAANQAPDKSVVVRGTEAGAEFTLGEDGLTLYESHETGFPHDVDTQLDGDMDPAGNTAQDEQFLSAVAGGRKPDLNTAEQGLIVQRVVDAIYRSSEESRTIRI